MENYGRSALNQFLQDRIVYRNLNPYDPALPGLEQIRERIGLRAGDIPRKNEADYARVIVQLLENCRTQDRPGARIKRLAFVGDTRLLDGTAYANLCRVSGWAGMAFIGAENNQPESFQVISGEGGGPLALSNRWSALSEFDRYCEQNNHPIDEDTAVVIDMDKTMVGARGRNGQVIDQARMDAVKLTVAGLLGDHFDPAAFQAAYDPLNQPEFHPFTGDNQDYLAYICLMLGSGLFSYAGVAQDVRDGKMATFRQFIAEVDARKGELPDELDRIHEEIYANVQAGDPTPFKPFRRNEYRLTVERFGWLEDSAPIVKMLAEEIVITQEVRQMALTWRGRGALLFGLSDKPDEASLPTPELKREGYLPLHQTETHAIGE